MLVAGLLAYSTALVAATSSPSDANRARLIDDFALLVEDLAECDDVTGIVVAVLADGGVALERSHGMTRLDGGHPIDRDTVFRGASLSKGMAATLAAMLAKDRHLDLQRPLPETIPEFRLKTPKDTSALTLERLLTHQTGLPSNAYDRLLEAGLGRGELLNKLGDVKLACPTGTCYWYQNIAFSLVADAVEQETGAYFEYLMADRVFEPLAMRHASFGREAMLEPGNTAWPHIWQSAAWRSTEPKPNYYELPAAAGVNISLADLQAWTLAQMGHHPKVLDEALLRDLHTPRVSTPSERWRPRWRAERLKSASYGLGFRIYDYAGHTLVFHAGAVQGYRAFMAFLPDQDLGLVAMWNSDSPRPWALMPTFFDAALGLKPREWLDTSRPIPAGSGAARSTRVAR